MSDLQNGNTLLDIQDLKTHFFTEEGVVRAVDGVSFKLEKNKILGLVGETGCGKSVTALSILKLIRYPGKIVSGSINFEGVDLTQLSEEEIRQYRGNTITMIFQDPMNSLNPVIRIGDQLGEVFLLHQFADIQEEIKERKEALIREGKSKEAKKIKPKMIAYDRSQKILETVGIPDSRQILERYPHELSGGMRQRVMIAMGIACNAKLLICDEPTTALDVTIQAQILKLILDLKKKIKNSVLFITHNLGVVYQLCDNVAVMYAGLIVEYGNVKDVFAKPQHPYTVGLLNSLPRVNKASRNQKLTLIPGLVPNLIVDIPGCRFHPRCPKAMKICQIKRPELIKVNNVDVACLLYDEEERKKNSKLFERIGEDEQRRYEV